MGRACSWWGVSFKVFVFLNLRYISKCLIFIFFSSSNPRNPVLCPWYKSTEHIRFSSLIPVKYPSLQHKSWLDARWIPLIKKATTLTDAVAPLHSEILKERLQISRLNFRDFQPLLGSDAQVLKFFALDQSTTRYDDLDDSKYLGGAGQNWRNKKISKVKDYELRSKYTR